MDFDPYTFAVSNVIDDYNYVMISRPDEARQETIDITDNILAYDQNTTALLFMTFMVFMMTMKILNSRVNAIVDFFGSLLSQNFGNLFAVGAKCLITISLLVYTFFTIHFITGNFKTDLVQTYPAKRIETLQDLAESSQTPLF